MTDVENIFPAARDCGDRKVIFVHGQRRPLAEGEIVVVKAGQALAMGR